MGRSLNRDSAFGEPEGELFTGDFEGRMKGFLFPPLGDSMEGASGRVPWNLKDEGYTKCPAGGPSSI